MNYPWKPNRLSPSPPPSMSSLALFLFFIASFQLLSSVSATEFIYNTDFNSSNIQLFGNATIQYSILTITNASERLVGRALYPSKITTKASNSSLPLPFSTSFIFSLAPFQDLLPGHGFVFLFTPVTSIDGGTTYEMLGLFNRTNNGNSSNHVFGIEFDTFQNEQFGDINDNHVGVDINSLSSVVSHAAGFWDGKDNLEFEDLDLNNGVNYQVWIDYLDSTINVTMARAGQTRPRRPLISKSVNLSSVLLDEMYVGFTGATGTLVQQTQRILAWSFSNTNFSIGDALVTSKLPSFVPSNGSVLRSKGFIIGVSLGAFFILCCAVVVFVFLSKRKRSKAGEEEIEDWELEYWPHRIGYEDIYAATKGFSDRNVIGIGGNGKVYKGVLQGAEVAVKRIPYERRSECSTDEVEKVLRLGLSCTHPNPAARPAMRQIVKVLEGENMDTSLLDKINSAATSFGYAGSFNNRTCPTMDELFQSHDASVTLIAEGR
ncbi:hypothetical protein L6164_022356 [Bauhinia variegata]|uniref:Uncharacterized protein n=1 Tax=Bauhinia variegata TaxID=167791 RepID=A0ACB9MFD7_BAUVA|nr:hypothetical protein L6164_022356 [Bauhinia variegata]